MAIRNNDGTVQVDRFDSTDVTAARVTWTSVGGHTELEVIKNGFIQDIVLNITAAGTTLDFKLWINGRDTNIRWVQSANFPTVDNRVPNMFPIPVSAGDKISIEAIT